MHKLQIYFNIWGSLSPKREDEHFGFFTDFCVVPPTAPHGFKLSYDDGVFL